MSKVKISRDFKGIWIPRTVWLDDRLSMLEKGILMEIDSLDTEDGCFASNEYIAEFCQCSKTKVSTTIKKLIELNYIKIKFFNGNERILKSNLSKSVRQPFKKCKPTFQKVKANNIINNNSKKRKINKKKVVKTPKWYNDETPIINNNNDDLITLEQLFKVDNENI